MARAVTLAEGTAPEGIVSMNVRTCLALLALPALAAACGPRPIEEVCGDLEFVAPPPAAANPGAGFHVYAHAHNDYEHSRPLLDALDHRFYSVEADVYFSEGRFEVSHNGFNAKGTLAELYLDPLQERVTQSGSVHGDGLTFTLWVDLKDDHPELVSRLDALLQQYPMLSKNDANVVDPEAVDVVLTGNAAAKERFSQSATVRRAFRDSNNFSPTDPPADPFWRYYALDWGRYIGWNGGAAIPPDTVERLQCILGLADANERKVRFYAAPDVPAVWDAILEHGGDFVGTDKLAELSDHLSARQ